jgi:hypothetical protein
MFVCVCVCLRPPPPPPIRTQQPLVNYTMPTNASATHLRNRNNITAAAQPPAHHQLHAQPFIHHAAQTLQQHTRTTAAATPPQLPNRCSKHLHYTSPHTTTHYTTLRAHYARERGIDRNHTHLHTTNGHANHIPPPRPVSKHIPIECGSGCRVRDNLFQTK